MGVLDRPPLCNPDLVSACAPQRAVLVLVLVLGRVSAASPYSYTLGLVLRVTP